MKNTHFLAAAVIALALTVTANAQPAPTSELTWTALGGSAVRDLRPQAISGKTDYLQRMAARKGPAAKVALKFADGAIKVGDGFMAEKKYADGAFRQAIKDDPNNANAWMKLGEALTGQNKPKEPDDAWQKSIELSTAEADGIIKAGAAVPPPAASPAQPAVETPSPAAVPASASPAPAGADKDAEIAQLKRRLAELDAAKTGAVHAPAASSATPAATAPAADNIPFRPLDQSELVFKDATGAPVVADKDGKGIDGIKLFAGDNFVSISTGDGKWSVPVNVTNNAGRKTYVSKATSDLSQVVHATSCMPGVGAAAFDRDGHLLLLMVKQEYAITHSIAIGVAVGGGDIKTPTLRFLKF